MNLNISGKNLQVTEGLRSYVEKKMDRVKYFFPHLIDVHVVMEVEKKIVHKVEITIQGDGKKFHSEFKAEDMYESIDKLIDRVERQIRRYKEKLHDFSSEKISLFLKENQQEQPEFVFTKIREIHPKPMDDEEALLQLNTSDFKFHIYKNSPKMTEEEYKKMLDKEIIYKKSIAIKEKDDSYVIIRRIQDQWEEDVLKKEGEQFKSVKKNKSSISDFSIPEAVSKLVESGKAYYPFFDKDHSLLSIVFKRKDNTLGLITSKAF